jgi:SAM-dependent methyltransferase
MTQPARLNEGSSPLAHMELLARAPERILALRLAMSSTIKPSSAVLDAGCGSLGMLAIMAARLGARRVVAVDTGRLDAAQALAGENGVADRIEFRQCDLADFPATESFDAILGMIYHNEPRHDLAQQQLMAGLVTRVAQPGAAFIPSTVRYTVAGYDSAGPDLTERTRQDQWDSAVGRAEALTGITMAAIRQFPSTDYSTFMEQLSQEPGPWAARVRQTLTGREMTMLTNRELLSVISYADPATASAYPPSLALTITAPGRLDTTTWRQDLMFGDLLIRSTETTYPLTPPCDVQPGDTAILSIGGGWGDAIPLTMHRDGRSLGTNMGLDEIPPFCKETPSTLVPRGFLTQNLLPHFGPIAVILSPPRCGSTVLARSFWQHHLFRWYLHEPCDWAYHVGLGSQPKSIASMLTDRAAVSGLDPRGNGVVIKEMTFQARDAMAEFQVATMPVIFLVRDPRLAVYSRMRRRELDGDVPAFPAKEAGWRDLLEELDVFRQSGKPYVIVNISDIRKNPATMLETLCRHLGLPWDSGMLHWKNLANLRLGNIAGRQNAWYARALTTTGWQPPDENLPSFDIFRKYKMDAVVLESLSAYQEVLHDAQYLDPM